MRAFLSVCKMGEKLANSKQQVTFPAKERKLGFFTVASFGYELGLATLKLKVELPLRSTC